MSKVLHIREVPDDVHAALAEAAWAQGQSLTQYVLRELEHLARRPQIVRDNAVAIRQTQQKVQGHQEVPRLPDREMILAVLHEGRGE